MGVAAGQHFLVIASNSTHCHPADNVFETNTIIPLFCPSLYRYAWLSNKDHERDRARISITLVQCHFPVLVAITKFKTTIINFSEFPWKLAPTNITHHTVITVYTCMYMYMYSTPPPTHTLTIFTIMAPALPSAMIILLTPAHYTWMEGTSQIVCPYINCVGESDIHTVLETLASSPGSLIFLKYSTECFKGTIKCQQKSLISTVGGSTSCITVTTPWCVSNKLK